MSSTERDAAEAGDAHRNVSRGPEAQVHVSASELGDDRESVDSATLIAKELGLSTQYERQVVLINKAIKEEIGFGPFQTKLAILAGFGWLADNIWFEALAVTLPQIEYEFGTSSKHVRFATFALYVSLLVSTSFWGICSDIIGRRPSWNITLFLSAVFGIAVGAAPSFPAMAGLLACLGLGLGGNLPVDGAMMIEFIPGSHQWLLTLLSLFWCIGQLFAALIGWAFITNYRCESADGCTRQNNMGWRYTWFLLGGVVLLMWIVRFFIYPIPESPKFLLATKREEEAIETLQFIARQNGKTTSLTLQKLREAGMGRTVELDATQAAKPAVPPLVADDDKKDPSTGRVRDLAQTRPAARASPTSWYASLSPQRIRETYRAMHRSPISALFASPRMSLNTLLICACWGAIGLAYPLYNSFIALYLTSLGVDQGGSTQSDQYRQLVIIAACGIPGSLIAAGMVELPYTGRRYSMAIFTVLTGVFLFLFTTARNASAVLGYNCVISLCQNAMYGILYALTYEVFPAPQRGTGDGLAMSTQRIFNVIATLVAIFASSNISTPLYVSASFFLVAAAIMALLPYEPRGRDSL